MKILYICTHNRCRSILSEAITNHLSDGRIQAFSAGSQPAGEVHPLSLKYLAEHRISTEGLQSQSWDVFESMQPDIVITVCDSAAAEQCPVWFGNTIKLHWGLKDPSKVEGSESAVKAAFEECVLIIRDRVRELLQLDLASKTSEQRQAALSELIERTTN
ncbi:MAG: arsenate reductase ArsC [Aequoribacter sp.]|uniref:arsenate reductase ArsC n=1 Tax=Aequoribacter sp. TaxID=2847771 RepID=UPI003C516C8C